MNIVLFGGTSDGRILTERLIALGACVTVCVATEYGEEQMRQTAGCRVLCGRKSAQEMAGLLSKADLCIDATHPYAAEASRQIAAAAKESGVQLFRLLRSEAHTPQESGVLFAENAVHAAELLQKTTGNIFLATGAKEVSAYQALPPQRLYVRVLPMQESLRSCEDAGIPRAHICAMQGPFSKAFNLALLRQWDIRWMVTKDSGNAGGFSEKTQAAREAGVGLIVLRRPEEQGMTMEEILKECERKMQ